METKFHVLIFSSKPVADRKFTFMDEFDDFPKEKQAVRCLSFYYLHFTLLPYSRHNL